MTNKTNKQNDTEARVYLGEREQEVYEKYSISNDEYPKIHEVVEYPGKEPYVPSGDLAQAVNLAMYLGRPLLLEGETGCGKSRLAFSVAWELGYPLFPYYVHSNAKAKDLLYTFEQLKQLYDFEKAKHDPENANPNFLDQYIRYGPLGWAIRISSSEKPIPSVVLIDEVDKGDYDFPNDLLLELERLEFRIEESEKRYKAASEPEKRPLIIITSNREKALPRPFLRRCVYHFVSFPEPDRLDAILSRQFNSKPPEDFNMEEATKVWNIAIEKFNLLRSKCRVHKPGTSELIDWVNVLLNWNTGVDLNKLELINDKTLAELPYLDLLVKSKDDRGNL